MHGLHEDWRCIASIIVNGRGRLETMGDRRGRQGTAGDDRGPPGTTIDDRGLPGTTADDRGPPGTVEDGRGLKEIMNHSGGWWGTFGKTKQSW